MEQSNDYCINNSKVMLIFGDLLSSKADVIVNSSGSKLTMSGGLTKAIRDAGGEGIYKDAQTKLPTKVGDVVVTTAGTLSQKHVFHCITIDKSTDHSNTPQGISEDEIYQYIIGHSIDKCFQLLQAMELKSIAFPAIGAGAAGIPFEKVAEVMSETIARNLRKTNRPLVVEIYLYDKSDEMSQWDFLPMFEHFSAQAAISVFRREQIYDELLLDEPEIPTSRVALPNINKDVFISYSRKDSNLVKSIYEHLEKANVKCWLDIDGMYSGVSFKDVIVKALKNSKVVLFMSSENSNKSHNVISEVSIAKKYEKKIIPVRLDKSAYSESIEYDLINHDYIVYNKIRVKESLNEILRKVVSTLRMK